MMYSDDHLGDGIASNSKIGPPSSFTWALFAHYVLQWTVPSRFLVYLFCWLSVFLSIFFIIFVSLAFDRWSSAELSSSTEIEFSFHGLKIMLFWRIIGISLWYYFTHNHTLQRLEINQLIMRSWYICKHLTIIECDYAVQHWNSLFRTPFVCGLDVEGGSPAPPMSGVAENIGFKCFNSILWILCFVEFLAALFRLICRDDIKPLSMVVKFWQE